MNKLFLPNIYAKNSLFYFDEACKNEISQENELFKLGQTFEEAGADGIGGALGNLLGGLLGGK